MWAAASVGILLLVGAGLLAKKAVERGLTTKPWVKTSFATGSKVVTDYIEKAGLWPYLNELRFNLVGYGCTTCIGNSGPLSETIGNYGVRSRSRSTGRTGRLFGASSISSGTTISEHARARIRPEEIMHDLREDAAIVVPKNGRPALCGRAIYFRRPEFLARVAGNRFARGGVDGRPRP